MKLAAVFLLLGCLIPSSAAWSDQGRIVRDATGVEAIGTATISGVVVSDDREAAPIRRAIITLAAGDLRGPMTTISDDAGRFVFADLRPGTYTLTATRAPYVPAWFGAKRPGRPPGIPIALVEGQQIRDVTIRMLRGGVITGTVRQPGGRPAASVPVHVISAETIGSSAQMPFAMQMAITDDRGVYRVFGLPPGDFIVRTRVMGGMAGTNARQITDDELRWAEQIIAGPRLAPAAGTPAPAVPAPGPMVTYAPVYYPGTTDAARAGTVRLGPGQERGGIDFAIELVPTTRVTGVAIGLDGRPLQGAQITARSPQGDEMDHLTAMLLGGAGSTRSGSDGTFALDNLRPGSYTISARAAESRDAAPAKPAGPEGIMGLMAGMFGGGAAGHLTLWADVEITADGRDVTDLFLRLQPGMMVSGRVMIEGSAPPPNLTSVRVSLAPMPASASPMEVARSMMGGMSAAAAEDGRFEIRGVTPERYRATVTMPGVLMGQTIPRGVWSLKSIDLGGRDVADLPFDMRPGQHLTDMVVTITDRPTRLSGVVIDPAGRPAPGFPIVIFPTDREFWLPGSRRIQQVRPSSDGRYEVAGLPAGEYFLSAVADLDLLQALEPSLLEHLAPAAIRITIAQGEQKTQDLKLGGG